MRSCRRQCGDVHAQGVGVAAGERVRLVVGVLGQKIRDDDRL